MSTRCQIQVQSKGLSWHEDPVMLYRHWDGHPSNILRLLREAQRNALTICALSYWLLGRVGKVAAFIVASDVPQFEPEPGSELHEDTDYLYVVTVYNALNTLGPDIPYWTVKVIDPRTNEILHKEKPVSKWTDAAIAKAV